MYVERDVKQVFETLLPVYNLIALVGPRQAGKTTFLKERMKGMNASYVLFDDPDPREMFNEDVKKFERQYLEGYEIAILDEVQNCEEAGRKLKYFADTGRKLWITSSSETLLAKGILSWLVGRVSILRLYPLSLPEFLRAKGHTELTPSILQRSIWEHAIYGGYPKVVTVEGAEIKTTVLRDLYETMILKDIAKTFSITDVATLETFSRYLSHSIGNPMVYQKFSSEMGISFQTIKKYVDAMEKSYLIKRVMPFYTNKGKEVIKQPKVYFVDTGLRNAIAGHFPATLENEGKLFENYVFTELLKAGSSVKYWQSKSKAEVDFIVEKGDEVLPIEVKVKAAPEKITESLRSFIHSYKPKIAVVVFYEGERGEVKVNGCRVVFTDIPGLRRLLG